MPLIFVATPLGNLGDITLRTLEAFRDASLVVAEDTRVARKLLNALAIGEKETWSYREQNAHSVTSGILARAARENVVVATDAGLPGISDPGSELVAAARAAKVPIEVLPGPSACVAVALLSGFGLRRFSFEGFPPRSSSQRRIAFREVARSGATSIWYESPQRIVATLRDLAAVSTSAQVFVVREYTKRFEQQLLGTPDDVARALGDDVRGEITFAIAPFSSDDAPIDDLEGEVDALLAQGRSVKATVRALAERGADRNEVYRIALERERGTATPDDEASTFE